MAEETSRWLNHFSLFSVTSAGFSMSPADRKGQLASWLQQLSRASPCVEVYQVYPAQADADVLVWSAMEVGAADGIAGFFSRFAAATNPYRHLIEPRSVLWGFTRPSQYTKSRSNQEIDPQEPRREPYLILYPFVKTVSWYLMSRDARQGMMNEHIRVGKQYPQIKQLLLYSFGLQDQEFIVVYETPDLSQFSDLVEELRSSEVRRFTERDTPLYTAVYHPAEETLDLWG